jgi:putative membrane protein
MYEWMKALHIIFMVTWFAGLFYLPRLFVYHAMPENKTSFALFKVMEHRLYIMMTLGGVLTLILGFVLFFLNSSYYLESVWFPAKLALVGLLIAYHIICRQIVICFRLDNNTRDHRWYRYFNEVPSLLLMGIVILVVVKI